MKLIALLALVLCSWASVGSAALPKSIFDDDWKPNVPPSAEPAAPTTTPAPAPADSRVTTPTPATAATAPSAVAVTPRERAVTQTSRALVPSTAAQAESWKLVQKELYKDDIARASTPEKKVELARKLLTIADGTTNDTIGRYVLFAQAKELAISSGDPDTAFKCLDEMGKAYEIDYPTMKLEMFAALANTVSSPADMATLVTGLNDWADGQVKTDRYDTAKRACDIALGVARKDRDAAQLRRTAKHRTEIEAIEKGYSSITSALRTLARAPEDESANLAVGRFYCFSKGDWDKGLGNLAHGSDARLKELALDESGATSAKAEMTLADSWWEIAEKETGHNRYLIRLHSAMLYERAQSDLSGLALVKAAKRIAEAREPEEPVTLAAKPQWQAIFRSSDPAVWNTDSKDKRRFAVPISKAPEGVQFLKMQLDAEKYVIIPMSNQRLGTESEQGRYGWDGRNSVVWGGHQLGIFDRQMNEVKPGPNGWVCLFWDNGPFTGYGFGFRAGSNDQGFAWEGQSIGTTVCEISVTTGGLTPVEKKHLLTSD